MHGTQSHGIYKKSSPVTEHGSPAGTNPLKLQQAFDWLPFFKRDVTHVACSLFVLAHIRALNCFYFIDRLELLLGLQLWLYWPLFFQAFLGVAALGVLKRWWHRIVILGHRLFDSKVIYQGDCSSNFVYNSSKIFGNLSKRCLNWAHVLGPFSLRHNSSILGFVSKEPDSK